MDYEAKRALDLQRHCVRDILVGQLPLLSVHVVSGEVSPGGQTDTHLCIHTHVLLAVCCLALCFQRLRSSNVRIRCGIVFKVDVCRLGAGLGHITSGILVLAGHCRSLQFGCTNDY
jgi:hypothetical protein